MAIESINPREIVEALADWWSDGGDVDTGPSRSAMYDEETTWGNAVRQCIDSESSHDRLIAAAPALLAACKAALCIHDVYSTDRAKRLTPEVADKLRAALALAE